MYIRKKNNENSRIKRPVKRLKSCDMFFTSGYGFYLKPIAIFSALLIIDFLMEIRVEYLWSCWLIMKSVTDSYKYQGLIFSLFFMLIVLTSDIICYLLIPITWLFFLASSYVWIQLVGYTERGICLPTVIICLFFFYLEYILRLRGFSHVSLSMEICRPFAANGIGYPVVTMGFGLKSYVTYKFRMRKQRDVEAENRFFFQLIDQALPDGKKRFRITADGENDTSSVCDGDSVENSSIETPPAITSSASMTCIGTTKLLKPNNISNGKVENVHSPDLVISKSQTSNIDYVDQWALSTQQKSSLSNGHIKSQKIATLSGCISDISNTAVTSVKKSSPSSNQGIKQTKDEIVKFDMELKKLRSDLQSGRNNQVDLKSQLIQASQVHNLVKVELTQCRQELLSIQNKFQSLQQKYQTEKQNSQLLEKKFNEERKNCLLLEQQLTVEKKARKDESEIKSKALQSVTLAAAKSSECTESCKCKRRQLDTELKSLKKDKQSREEQIRNLEQQLLELPKLRKMFEEYQHMSKNSTSLRDENDHLIRTLSDENKIKQNLITAYHSSLKEVNALNEQLTQKDYQILHLNMNGAADYMNNQQQTHYHQMQRHTPSSSSPLSMDESNYYAGNSLSSPSSMYTTMMNACLPKSPPSSSINGGQCQSHHSNNNNNNNTAQQQQQQQQSVILSSSSSSLSLSGLNGPYNKSISSQSGLNGGDTINETHSTAINQW